MAKTILFHFFIIASLALSAQKADTLTIYPSKYSFSKTDWVWKFGRKLTGYYLGYNTYSGDTVKSVFDEVEKDDYDAFEEKKKRFTNCKPCWQKIYRNNYLQFEGLMETDCIVGRFTEYWKNGKVKLQGQYEKVKGGIFKGKPTCSIRTAEWNYFNELGKLEKVEFYQNDVLIKTTIHQ